MKETGEKKESLATVAGQSPEFLGLFILVLVAIGFVIVEMFYLPLIIAILSAIIFIAIFVVTIRSGLLLNKLKLSAKSQTAELHALIENIKDGVVVYDQEFKILEINGAFEEIVGSSRNNIVGKTIGPEMLKSPELSLTAQILFPSLASSASQISEEGIWPQIAEIVAGDPQKTLLLTLNRLSDENGKILGFIKIVGDETREKAIIESKNEFIKIAAHQLRTPLTAIKWAFENLTKSANGDSKVIADEGLNLSDRSLKIVNDLLTASEIEEGKFGFSLKKSDVVSLVSSVIESARPAAEEFGIKISLSMPTGPLFSNLDSERIILALSNILDNAIRYNSKNGSVFVTVEENSLLVKISVRDTGVGIPKGEVERVFSKFYRGQNISNLEPNGSGLGLYLARNIVKKHGGEIGIDSEMGRGTTIWFTLPKA